MSGRRALRAGPLRPLRLLSPSSGRRSLSTPPALSPLDPLGPLRARMRRLPPVPALLAGLFSRGGSGRAHYCHPFPRTATADGTRLTELAGDTDTLLRYVARMDPTARTRLLGPCQKADQHQRSLFAS